MPRKRNVGETYQKLSQLEHILVRPDTYVGSIEKVKQKMWVYDDAIRKMVEKEISYVPGLYKIFDEILVNAADNFQRDPTMQLIEVRVNQRERWVSITNDGKGIPIEIHPKQKIYVPEMIFGNLLTSSNYNDKQRKTTGGRNGYGAKLANIFSTQFTVETVDSEQGKKYVQTWKKNMSVKEDYVITDSVGVDDYTKITFYPDLEKFGMKTFERDVVALFRKRVFDIAGTTPRKLKVRYNGRKVPVKTFEDYCALYLTEGTKTVYERVNERWQVCVASQETGHFKQVSHVNNIWTIKGGQHCNYVADQLVNKIVQFCQRKNKKITIKPIHAKNHIFLFVNCLIENPAFTSQTKEYLSLKQSKFGSTCDVSEALLKRTLKLGIVENVLAYAQYRQGRALKKQDGKKVGRVTGIPKLDDANDAGGKHSSKCTLILTEGLSAKSLAVSGLSVVGRNRYGVFPLKGKLLNVRDASTNQITKNAEITNIRKIMGLKMNVDYGQDRHYESLRYGRLMIMTDQDHDGSHIKGLVINFIHHFWPSLLKRPGFLTQFITPIIVAKKGKEKKAFYTIPQYESWKKRNNNAAGWRIKYYKGLGTSSSAEAKEYFSNLPKHVVDFNYTGERDADNISKAFSKKRVEDRKQWLEGYRPGTHADYSRTVNYSDFVNKELILFSIADCARSIPSIADGLKTGQRKVLFACFKRKLKKEIKVAQLAGYVAEHSAYHHGEMSLQGTIVGLAQNYPGSNNLNLLFPSGQFGTRHQGGKDSASARYINTRLCEITRYVFPEADDLVMKYLDDDGLSVEPEYYVPIIPMVLVNGADGIGTGWSTFIPNYDIRDVIQEVRRLLRGERAKTLHPQYTGWSGQIYPDELNKYSVWGNAVQVPDKPRTIEIHELPIRLWTDNYKNMLDKLCEEGHVLDFRANHTDTTIHFEVKFSDTYGFRGVDIAFMKKMNLIKSLTTSNFVLFDSKNKLKKYKNANEILKEFYALRLKFYDKRKKALINKLTEQLEKLSNKQKFIWMVVQKQLEIRKKKKKVLCDELLSLGFKIIMPTKKKGSSGDDSSSDSEEADKADKGGANHYKGYDYLLKMPIYSLTAEKVQKILDEKEEKEKELNELIGTPIKLLWRKDLDALEKALEDHEAAQEKLLARAKELIRKKQKKKGKVFKSPSQSKGKYFRKKGNEKLFAKKKKTTKTSKKKQKSPKKMMAPSACKLDPELQSLIGGFGFLDDDSDNEKPAKSSLKNVVEQKHSFSDSSDDDMPIFPVTGTKTSKLTSYFPKKQVSHRQESKAPLGSSSKNVLKRNREESDQQNAKRRKTESGGIMLEPPDENFF